MLELIAPGEVRMWGNGCLNAPMTTLDIAPTAAGWQIEITIRGVQIYDRHAPDNTSTTTFLLAPSDAHDVLAVLVDESPRTRASTDRTYGMSGIGNIDLKLPMRTGNVDVLLRAGPRMIAVAEQLLRLLRCAGIAVDDRLHPIPRELR